MCVIARGGVSAMRYFLCGIMVLGGVIPAMASGGVSCSNSGGPVAIELSAGITRGMGSPVFSLTAVVETKKTNVGSDLKKGSFNKENLAQYWLDDKEMKLLLYRERDGAGEFGSVELLIVTSRSATISVTTGPTNSPCRT
jgi:hypothetical protein